MKILKKYGQRLTEMEKIAKIMKVLKMRMSFEAGVNSV